MARLAKVALWLVFGAWLLVALSWGVLHGMIVPRVEQWRPALERLASRSLGVTVSIDRIQALSDGPVPGLRLTDVALKDPDGREVLRLPEVRAALSIRSLWRLGFDQLVIEQPVLDVRRTLDGRVLLAGMDMTASPSGKEPPLLDWFFDQPEFAVRGGTLRWTDEARPDAPVLELQDIQWVSRNPGRQHQFRLDATPPTSWGQPFSIQGQFVRPLWQTRAGQWRDWVGTLFLDLPGVDAQAIRAHVDTGPALGVELREGRGATRVWADVSRGRITAVTTDLALEEVAVEWPGTSQPLTLQDLQTRLDIQQRDRTTRVATRGLAFVTAEGARWPGGNVRYTQTLDAAGALLSFDVEGDRLDAQALRQLAQRLPLPEALASGLQDTAVNGTAEVFRLEWIAPSAGQPARWTASGRLRGVELKPADARAAVPSDEGGERYPLGRPGVAGADIDFSWQPSGGTARIAINQGTLAFPGLFEDPVVAIDQLQADVAWTQRGEDIEVDVPRLVLVNRDMEADASVRWRTADPATSPARSRYPGVLTLDARVPRADAARVVRYLPQSVSADVRRYLSASIAAGQVRDGRIRVAGDAWHFPFTAPGTGDFTVSAQLQQVDYDYVPGFLMPVDGPGWPGLRVTQARLDIDRGRVVIADAQAMARDWPQLRVVTARAEIADMLAAVPSVAVEGQVRGRAADALAFMDRSAVRVMTGGALAQAQATGTAELDLSLRVPLAGDGLPGVTGVVRLSGNDLRLTPDTPWLQGLQGTVRFTEAGFEVPSATGRLLGGPVQLSGRMEEGLPRRVTFRAQGQATVEALAQADHWPWLAPLARVATGSAPYQVVLDLSAQGTGIQVDSTLQGLTLQAPEPFDKPAAVLLPLRVRLQPIEAGPRGVPRDELLVQLGAGREPLLSLHVERERDPSRTRVLRGSLAVRSEPPGWPAQGVRARVQLDRLVTDDWSRLLGPSLSPTMAGASGDDRMAYWPTEWGLTVGELRQGARTFRRVVAGGTRDGDQWRLSVDADELSGYVEYRQPSARGAGQLYARLARLDLSTRGATDVERLLQEPTQAIPAVDLVVDRFRMGDRDLGRLEVQAVNRQSPLAAQDRTREWRLNTFNLTVPEARLEASGNWATSAAQPDAARRTALRIRLDIQDAGQLLARFGMPDVVRGGRGGIDGHIGWIGSPLNFDPPTLAGQLAIDLERGQFLKAEPGIAKLLGVLSLQSLPRRLTLDFRDVFSEGFAFDFVRGNARIADGVATTNNLQMKGVSAAVLLEGRADVVRETQDITAVVIPELNAGTASLVATIISPVTGLGTFLAQFLLRQPLQEAATRQFRITGPWADPQVERVTRRNIPPGDASIPPNSTGVSPP